MGYLTPVVVELYYSGAWHDHSSRVAANPPLMITRGRADETQQAAPGMCTLTLLNTDAKYSPRNPESTLYGLIGRNTPIRVSVTGYGTRFVGEVESWPQVADTSGKIVRAGITAYGVTRRLGAGGSNAPIKSPMRRFYDTASPAPVAYWPLESGDRRAALSFPSALRGGAELLVTESTQFGVTRPFSAAGGVTPGPAGAASATDTSAGGHLVGDVQVVSGATTARAEVSMLANGFENTFPGLVGIRNTAIAASGAACNMDIVAQLIGGSWYVGAIWNGPTGSADSYTASPVILQDNEWHLLQLDQTSAGSGADTAWVIRIDGTTVLSGTATGYTWAPPKQVLLNDLATDMDRVAHFAVWSGTSLPTASDSYDAFLAYTGETVADRLDRLGNEDGIVTTVTGTAGTLLGPQPVATAMALRQECIDADGGVLLEDRDDLTLTYVAFDAFYNQAVDVTLDYTAKEVTPPFQPTEDTRHVANDVTVTRSNGGSYTATRDTGPLNTSEPSDDPQGVGRYQRAFTLNLATDAQTVQQAGWRLHVGTWDDPRYPSITANLTGLHEAGKTTLMADLAALDVAGRIEVTNPPAWQGPETVSQRVEGYTETPAAKMWTVTFNTSPARPYDVGVLDTDRVTTAGCVTAEALDSTETGVDVTNDDNGWSATSVPYDIAIGGERMTVTAVTGTGTSQTLTVTRSVNGVTKSHTAGAAVDLFRPFRLAR